MDYKKAYEEALEKARYIKENCDCVNAKDIESLFEQVFPELKESDDEKTRRELIERLKWELDGAEQQDAAGCSRQKDIEMFKRGIAWLEKQKPIKWTSEDEANMDAVWKACGHVYGIKYQGILGDWLKTLRPHENKNNKEYEDGYIDLTIAAIEEYYGDKNPLTGELVSWIKEHKEIKMIQWTGDNLKEVIKFTGLSPEFSNWFKSWDEYEMYVHSHNDIFKLFFEDGSHYEVPKGAWIIRTPDGYNVASKSKFIEKQKQDVNKPVEIRFPHYNNIIEKVFGAGNLESWEYKEAEALVHLAKEELLKDLQEQKPKDWSEEDETMMQNILDCLRNGQKKLPTDILKYESWLKSLRFQKQWKPTKEQIETLEFAASYVDSKEDKSVYNSIRLLIDELERLM